MIGPKPKLMFLDHQRIAGASDSTLGTLHIDDEFSCFVIEDQHQEKKVKAETRIPAGFREIVLRDDINPQVLTPMTKKYRNRFKSGAFSEYGYDRGFDYHLMIAEVEYFTNTYLHIGNDDDDTEGCLLTNLIAGENTEGQFSGQNSTEAFKRVYAKVRKHIAQGGQVFIRTRDERKLG